MLHKNLFDKSKSVPEQQSLFANDDIILIPVVVHVVWNTISDNLSNAQIQSQIEVLNEDFRRLNTDADDTPGLFLDVAGDSRIQFYLDCRSEERRVGNVCVSTFRSRCSPLTSKKK